MRPPEIVNSVEGSFTFKDETVKLSHAYARTVENEDDKTKQDVLIVFTGRPVSAAIRGTKDNLSQKIRTVLEVR